MILEADHLLNRRIHNLIKVIDKAEDEEKIANSINKYCNNKAEIIFQDRRDWDCVIHRRANIDKITSLLGFRAETKIDEGIRKTCDWVKNI